MTMRRGWTRALIPALFVVIIALVAGCSSGGKANTSATQPGGAGTGTTPGATMPDSGLSATATVLAQTPTVTPKPGTGGQQGLAEFCAQPASVAVQLPASVPAYPNARLRVSQTSGGNGIYGLCTVDSVDAVATYYTAQLPAKGWQSPRSTTIQNVQQLTASQGNAQVIVTIEPDAQISGTTQIIILTSGLNA